jgi:hypothetical protein
VCSNRKLRFWVMNDRTQGEHNTSTHSDQSNPPAKPRFKPPAAEATRAFPAAELGRIHRRYKRSLTDLPLVGAARVVVVPLDFRRVAVCATAYFQRALRCEDRASVSGWNGLICWCITLCGSKC